MPSRTLQYLSPQVNLDAFAKTPQRRYYQMRVSPSSHPLFLSREDFIGIIVYFQTRHGPLATVWCEYSDNLTSASTFHASLWNLVKKNYSGLHVKIIGFSRQNNKFVIRSATFNEPHFADRQGDPKELSFNCEKELIDELVKLKVGMRTN